MGSLRRVQGRRLRKKSRMWPKRKKKAQLVAFFGLGCVGARGREGRKEAEGEVESEKREREKREKREEERDC